MHATDWLLTRLCKVALCGWLLLSCCGLNAQPLLTPDAAIMEFDDLGLYSVGYAYRGQPEQYFPTGWSGSFEERTGVSCLPAGTQNGRRAFLLHCPWRNGTGIAFQQFAFQLPTAATRVLLSGATAIRSDIVTNSDGVTFRLYANGAKLMDYHQTNSDWRDFQFDLSAWRGSNVTVRFEVDPGPRNNASFDFSLWGNRRLILENYAPTPTLHPTPLPLALSNVVSAQTGDVVPRNAFSGTNSFLLSNNTVRFFYRGADGTFEYVWQRPQAANDPLFGVLVLHAQMAGDAPVAIPLAGSPAIAWPQTATPLTSVWQMTNNGFVLVRTFQVGTDTATVRTLGRLLGKTLCLEMTCDQPRIQSLDGGGWGPVMRRQQITTPYYSGLVYYLGQENLFVNAFLDWTASAASSQSGTKAAYSALTDGTRNCLRERLLFSAGWHLAEVLPNLPAPPSPWRNQLANKIILDIWGGSFTNIARQLATLADYGITNCIALVHVWQRSGYDNALPAHLPANANLGGDTGMSNLVATGHHLGITVALHENYVDYYPNYDFFDTNDIALDSSGNLIQAWYNEGTGIQSYAEKPGAILRLAATQSPEIHQRFGTRAAFLDVHSAVPPWFHVDFRTGETNAGMFQRVWDVHRQLWAYERANYGGPIFGEGNRHWYWSGYLDGVEAQFGQGWSENNGLTAPLNVDFDLLKIHPLQFNHGMGYYERWWPDNYEANWAGTTPMIVVDQYRLQEIAFGHAGFLGGSTYYQVPLAWLEHHLLSPVTERHATAQPAAITYEANGNWLDSTAAAKPASGTTNNRVRIQFDNGLVLTANGNSNALSLGNWTLPQFGWLAEGTGVTAGTVLRDNVVVDFADTGDSLFVNARALSDWNLASFRRVRPSVTNFQQTAARTFRAAYAWQVDDTLSKDYRSFVHFATNGSLLWQQDHSLTPPTSQWQPGQVIMDGPYTINLPSTLGDGDYDWLIGLYDSSSGSRLKLLGVDDGSSRIRLGVLHVRTNDASITFTPETNAPTFNPGTWYLQHLNTANAVVDFGDVRTDGSVRLQNQGNLWTLKTWPRTRNFTLEFSTNRFPQPPNVQSIGGASDPIAPVPAGTRWRLPLNGATEYRWSQYGVRPASLIPAGSIWKYQDNATDLGSAWRDNDYDDSAWKSGPAELGFGDVSEGRPETTLIDNNRQWTTYFRRTFYVPTPTLLQGLIARLLRDDGAVVYLNGTEVWRSNMPTNTSILYSTPASTGISGSGEITWYTNKIDSALLQAGWNLLAVEVHQNQTNSSDLSFDLELSAQVLIASPPAVTMTPAAISWPAEAGFFQVFAASNLVPPVIWIPTPQQPTFAGQQWLLPITPGSNSMRFFRLQTQ